VLDGGRSHEALASLRVWEAARDHAPVDDPRTVSRFGRLR
jgi:hypothetical protein